MVLFEETILYRGLPNIVHFWAGFQEKVFQQQQVLTDVTSLKSLHVENEAGHVELRLFPGGLVQVDEGPGAPEGAEMTDNE